MIASPPSRFTWIDALFLMLWAVASFVLLKGLGHTLLWQDEAHNALLAERILRFGYPRVWDGNNLITGMNGMDFNASFALTWDGWLPYYAAAASFAVLEPSAFSARLPFALAGVAVFPALYLLVRRLFADRWLALWSCAFLAASIAFLMHARQGRYYALALLASLVAFHGLARLPRKRGVAWLALGAAAVYHCSPLAFLLLYASFLLVPVFFPVDRARVRSFAVASALTFAGTFPMFWYARMWEKGSGFKAAFDAALYVGEVFGDLIYLNKFYVPLALLAFGAVFGRKFLDRRLYRTFSWIVAVMLLCAAVIPLKFGANNRYLLPLLPAAALAMAAVHLGVWRRKKAVGAALFAITLTTHAWDYLPMKAFYETAKAMGVPEAWDRGYRKIDDEEGAAIYAHFEPLYVPTVSDRFWKGEYASFLHELFHPFDDGLAEVIAFLRERRSPGERVYLSVGQYPLLFHAPEIPLAYTISAPLSFAVGGTVDASQWDMSRIDWFVPRFYRQMAGPHLTEENFRAWVEGKGWRLERHELKTPDLMWEGNWPYWFRFYRIKQGEFPLLNRAPTVVYRVLR